jgi:hypothetical protein
MNGYKYLELKAELLVNGITATKEALAGLGSKFKEQNHGLFGWDFEDHTGNLLPDDFLLPDGTVVQFRKNSKSRYRVRANNGDLMLSNGEEDLCQVRWLPRPRYYDTATSRGNKMVKTGQIGGEVCSSVTRITAVTLRKVSSASFATSSQPLIPITQS